MWRFYDQGKGKFVTRELPCTEDLFSRKNAPRWVTLNIAGDGFGRGGHDP